MGGTTSVQAMILVCPAALDASGVPTVYLVASTKDRLLPPHLHSDVIVEEFKSYGVDCTYQLASLGDHGIGVHKKWVIPCAVWLKEKLGWPQRKELHAALPERPDVVDCD